MTDEEWVMVQKTPEWTAEQVKHSRAMTLAARKMRDKFERKQNAMEARHKRERQEFEAQYNDATIELEELSNDLQNAANMRVFAKYGLTPGRS